MNIKRVVAISILAVLAVGFYLINEMYYPLSNLKKLTYFESNNIEVSGFELEFPEGWKGKKYNDSSAEFSTQEYAAGDLHITNATNQSSPSSREEWRRNVTETSYGILFVIDHPFYGDEFIGIVTNDGERFEVSYSVKNSEGKYVHEPVKNEVWQVLLQAKRKTSNKKVDTSGTSTNTQKTNVVNVPGEFSKDIDTDQDGLPDEFEAVLKTNPNNPDTDGDGFNDGEELQKGYNPNGPGKLEPNPMLP